VGKSTALRSMACRAGADVVLYVVCGERGVDAAEAAEEIFGTGVGDSPARAILIVNSSDMPAAGRDLAVCLGMTLAEHYRGMGYGAAVMVDSASGWMDGLRGIGACLAEVSRRGGGARFPAYLGSRVSACFGRAGEIETASGRGSVTLLMTAGSEAAGSEVAGSEAGGSRVGGLEDASAFHVLRSGAYWHLDRSRARAWRFPALDRKRSRSPYGNAPGPTPGEEDDWPELAEYLKTSLAPAPPRDGEAALSSALSEWGRFHAGTVEAVYLEQESAARGGARADLLRFLRALDRAARKALSEGRSCEEVTALVSRPELLSLRGLSERDFKGRARQWLEDFAAKLPSAKLPSAKLPSAKSAEAKR
jgi:hypothetical protein